MLKSVFLIRCEATCMKMEDDNSNSGGNIESEMVLNHSTRNELFISGLHFMLVKYSPL